MSGQDGGALKVVCVCGGVRFQPSRKKGRWARRLLHLPATFEGELESGGARGGCCVGQVAGGWREGRGGGGGGTQGTPLHRYI